MTPAAPMRNVYPSGFDFATYSAPIAAPAPGLFSITTGCLIRFDTPSAAARAMRSFAPPGEDGTIHLTGRSGHSAAWAGIGRAERGLAAESGARRIERMMGVLL